MTRKFVYGNPIRTDAVTVFIEPEKTEEEVQEVKIPYGTVSLNDGFEFVYQMDADDIVYGLGEANRGINKRGYCYISDCADDPEHTEDKRSLYAAHNFIVIAGKENFGLFFDYPSTMTFDIGYTKMNTLCVTCENADLDLYVIEGDSPYDIVKQFRKLIGRSYIPPKFAFGYGQSRWGYETKDDFREVLKGYREHHIPLDMIYMDIDYMQDFKDFSLNEKEFADFPAFVQEMKKDHIRLIPIIDAGVKIEDGYSIYEEGVQGNYFCQREDGSNFVGAVWPGAVHYPDFLNEEARRWFGDKYRFLTDQGIEGFWNDMNEPSIFYSEESMEETKALLHDLMEDESNDLPVWVLMGKLGSLANSHEDYKRYGYYMTRAAGEAFERIEPNKRFLMFSRSSYIGMHRYGGIWTGDNKSWWSHLLLNLKMLPSLNMCGFLYAGADLGGFGADATKDLLMRWLALGVFTPLMRNHAAKGTRRQECWQFEDPEDFRGLIEVRYRLIPYLYSEYMKAALQDDLYFKPLAFVYPEDQRAVRIEDQMMLGNEIMIAPVYEQNARGRMVYLPEEMKFVKFLSDGTITEEILGAGDHFVDVALDEVPLFIRTGKCIPVGDPAKTVDELNEESLKLIGYPGSSYNLYTDDGIGKDYENPDNYRVLKMKE